MKKSYATYEINESGMDYDPSDKDYFNSAWECAVEDGVVDASQRRNFSFFFS